MLFSPPKMRRFDLILQQTQTTGPLPSFSLSRDDALACAEAKECDVRGSATPGRGVQAALERRWISSKTLHIFEISDSAACYDLS